MNITDVIYYILASSKFGVRTPWGWHRHAETCKRSETLHGCLLYVHLFGYINELKSCSLRAGCVHLRFRALIKEIK